MIQFDDGPNKQGQLHTIIQKFLLQNYVNEADMNFVYFQYYPLVDFPIPPSVRDELTHYDNFFVMADKSDWTHVFALQIQTMCRFQIII